MSEENLITQLFQIVNETFTLKTMEKSFFQNEFLKKLSELSPEVQCKIQKTFFLDIQEISCLVGWLFNQEPPNQISIYTSTLPAPSLFTESELSDLGFHIS